MLAEEQLHVETRVVKVSRTKWFLGIISSIPWGDYQPPVDVVVVETSSSRVLVRHRYPAKHVVAQESDRRSLEHALATMTIDEFRKEYSVEF